jgi:hypothetical protein
MLLLYSHLLDDTEARPSQPAANETPEQLRARLDADGRDFQTRSQAAMRAKLDAIRAEQAAGVFGPATQAAYGLYINRTQTILTNLVSDNLDRFPNFRLPGNLPFRLPMTDGNYVVEPQVWRRMVQNGQAPLDLRLNPANVPTDATIRLLVNCQEAQASCTRSLTESNNITVDLGMSQLIRRNNLPLSWLDARESGGRVDQLLARVENSQSLRTSLQAWRTAPGPDTWAAVAREADSLARTSRNPVAQEAQRVLLDAEANADSYRQTRSRLVTYFMTLKGYVEEGQYYADAAQSWSSNYRWELPPGVTVRRQGTGTSADDRRITSIDFSDLPDTLNFASPRMEQLLYERYQPWLNRTRTEIERIRTEAGNSFEHMWGDVPVPSNCRVLFDREGKPVGIVRADYLIPAGSGQRFDPSNNDDATRHNVPNPPPNLLSYRYSTDSANGQVRVNQEITAYYIPPYGWNNWIYNTIGNTATVQRDYRPDQFVRINDGSNPTMLCRANDLSSFKACQVAWHWGPKILDVALLASMLIPVVGEVTAAIRVGSLCARAAALTGREIASFTAREIAMQGARLAWRSALMGSMIFGHNAWGETSTTGQWINTLGNIGWNLEIFGGPLMRLPGLRGIAQAGERFEQAMTDAKWMNATLRETSDQVATWSMRGMGLMIANGYYHQIFPPNLRDNLEHADRMRANDNGINLMPDRNLFDLSRAETRDENFRALTALINDYSTSMRAGVRGTNEASTQTRTQIEQIFNRVRELAAPGANAEQREQFRRELARTLLIDQQAIASAERSREAAVTVDQVRGMIDVNGRYYAPQGATVQETRQHNELRTQAEASDGRANRDVRVASALALALLSTNNAGQLANNVTVNIDMPEQGWDTTHSNGRSERTVHHSVPAHTLAVEIRPQDMITFLRQDLGVLANQMGPRQVAVGDALMHYGQLPGVSFASVLRDVISNPNSTPADLINCLSTATGPRLVEVMRRLDLAERAAARMGPDQAAQFQALTGGLTSANVRGLVQQLVGYQPRDPRDATQVAAAADVRAMASVALRTIDDYRSREGLFSATEAASMAGRVTPNRLEDLRRNLAAMSNPLAEIANSIPQNVAGAGAWRAGEPAGTFSQRAITQLTATLGRANRSQMPDDVYIGAMQRLRAAESLAEIDTTPANQTLANRTYANTILQMPDLQGLREVPGTNHLANRHFDLALEAARQLYPERIRTLEAAQQTQIRARLISMLQNPDSPDSEVRQIALLQALRSVMSGATAQEQAALSERLRKLVDRTQQNDYAAAYPMLRVEALLAIADFNIRDAVDLVRARTTPAATLQLGNTTIRNCGEEDGRVRLAALIALERLGDERLGEIVSSLVRGETDPVVAVKLRELSQTYLNPVVNPDQQDRDQNNAQMQALIAQMVRDPRYALADRLRDPQVWQWVTSQQPTRLLSLSNWTQSRLDAASTAYQARWGGFGGWFNYWVTRDSTIENDLNNASRGVDGQRQTAWDNFQSLAMGVTTNMPAGSMLNLDTQILRNPDGGAVASNTTTLRQILDESRTGLTSQIQTNITDIQGRITANQAEQTRINQQITQREAQLRAQQPNPTGAVATLVLQLQQQNETDRNAVASLRSALEIEQQNLARERALLERYSRAFDTSNGDTQIDIASALAQRTLASMIAHGTAVMTGDPTNNPNGNPTNNNISQYTRDNYSLGLTNTERSDAAWRRQAAAALANCCTQGRSRELAVNYVRDLLTRESAVPADCRLPLLNAFTQAARPRANDPLSIGIPDRAAVFLAALELELQRRPNEQNLQYQYQLINELRNCNYRPAYARLQAMADLNRFDPATDAAGAQIGLNPPERRALGIADNAASCGREERAAIRAQAANALVWLRDSIAPLYENARPDRSMNDITRASRTNAAADAYFARLTSQNVISDIAANQAIQAIFNNYRGYDFRSEADPGIAALGRFLEADNQKVRLAAAHAMLEAAVDLDQNHPVRLRAMGVLCDLAVRARNPQTRKDAYNYLNRYAVNLTPTGPACSSTWQLMENGTLRTISLAFAPNTNVYLVERTNGEVTGHVTSTGDVRQFVRLPRANPTTPGVVAVLIENGRVYVRQPNQQGQVTEQCENWRATEGGRSWDWVGTCEINDSDGSYTYTRRSDNQRWTTTAAGAWRRLNQ